MNRFKAAVFVSIAAIFWLVVGGKANAGFTFLGPSPYLSAADSPFDLSGLGSAFFLEDFEDLVSAPGLDLDFVTVVRTQGRSVDADDSAIDGSGAQGHSAQANISVGAGSSSVEVIRVDFNFEDLGFLPTAVGLVITDGAGSMSGLTATDRLGNQAFMSTESLHLDPLSTSDDRFIGVINQNGIARVDFSKTRNLLIGGQPFPYVDHLQYGLFVPEPSGAALVAVGELVYWTWRIPRVLT